MEIDTVAMATIVGILTLIASLEGRFIQALDDKIYRKHTWSEHVDFLIGNDAWSEDVVVDPDNLRLTVTGWGVTPSSVHGVFDYKQGVAGFIAPSSGHCFVIETLSDSLPLPKDDIFSGRQKVVSRSISDVEESSSSRQKMMFEPGEQVSDVNELPEELLSVCRHWPVYTLRRTDQAKQETSGYLDEQPKDDIDLDNWFIQSSQEHHVEKRSASGRRRKLKHRSLKKPKKGHRRRHRCKVKSYLCLLITTAEVCFCFGL